MAVVIEAVPVEQGARSGRQVKRFDQPEITIGRSPGSDVVLESDSVSRRHARIVVEPDRFVLVDASENGSSINGEHGWGERGFREGDDVRVGPYRLIVRRMPFAVTTR